MHHVHFETTDSTNTQARLLAERRPGLPLLVTADAQSAGRGRHGRSWGSPPGGAWLSVAWPLCRPPLHYAAVSLAAAVAVRRAIDQLARLASLRGAPSCPFVQIKWPNDLLINNAKVAGILCEQVLPAPAGAGALIVGVGVNVDFDLALLGGSLRHPPATLRAALGSPVAVSEVVHAVAEQLADALREFDEQGLSATAVAELREHLAYVGEIRRWQTPRGVVEGRVHGVDDAGRLLFETAGETLAFDVGEFVGDPP